MTSLAWVWWWLSWNMLEWQCRLKRCWRYWWKHLQASLHILKRHLPGMLLGQAAFHKLTLCKVLLTSTVVRWSTWSSWEGNGLTCNCVVRCLKRCMKAQLQERHHCYWQVLWSCSYWWSGCPATCTVCYICSEGICECSGHVHTLLFGFPQTAWPSLFSPSLFWVTVHCPLSTTQSVFIHLAGFKLLQIHLAGSYNQ